MEILPIKTPLLKAGDDLAAILGKHGDMQAGDIVVVSSKAIATVEGSAIDLGKLKISAEAKSLAEKTGEISGAAFYEAVLQECKRLHGKIIGHCPGAALTALRPKGMNIGWILTANAGLDQSNVMKEHAIGWPRDMLQSMRKLRAAIRVDQMADGRWQKQIALVISDSCCRPMRLGVTAIALAASGIDPIRSLKGTDDLFGRALRITNEAIADQLATAANAVMGNADQSIPAAIIRDHGIPFSDFEGWVPGIDMEEDIYKEVL